VGSNVVQAGVECVILLSWHVRSVNRKITRQRRINGLCKVGLR